MNKSLVLAVGVCTVFLSVAALAGPTQDQMAPRSGDLSQKATDRVTREVRHELVMLPYYGVFDNLAYSCLLYTSDAADE